MKNDTLQQKLLRISTDELERILDLRDQQERNLAIGRGLGAMANRRRAEEHREIWERVARQVLTDKPYLWRQFDQVAAAVLEHCRIHHHTLKNGRPYKLMTICQHIAKNADKLRAQP